jgi:hypothetical protein
MGAYSDARQKIKSLPRAKRLILVVTPLIVLGVVNTLKARARNDGSGMVAAGVIFFVIAPLFAVVWDRFRNR